MVPYFSSAATVCQRWSGRSGCTIPARVSVTSVWSLVWASVASWLGFGIKAVSYLDGSLIPGGSAPVSISLRISAARLRVEVDVTLADGRLLGEQPRLQQRLPHLLRERAVVAGEASRKVRELGVVAAPLAHAVEALEDPAAPRFGRVGVLVRADRLAAGAEQGEHGVLDVVVRAGRAAAEPRDGLGDPQRVARADRRA